MKSWTTSSILFGYKQLLSEYSSIYDDCFKNYGEKYLILISQIIWFSFWLTHNIYMAIGSGMIIILLTLYLSYYDYRDKYKEKYFLLCLLKIIPIVVIIIIFLVKYWKNFFIYGTFIFNLLLIIFYYAVLYEFIHSDYKNYYYTLKDINNSLSKSNIIINLLCILNAFFIKIYLLIINYGLKIVVFASFIILKNYLTKKKEEKSRKKEEKLKKLKEKKIKMRKKIQSGKFKTIICKPSEEEFNFKKKQIIYKRPREICYTDWKMFVEIKEYSLMNKIDDNIHVFKSDSKNDYFIMQTNIGDCFLVSSIISLVNIPGILDYLFYFENYSKDNYTDADEEISLFCYLKGIRYIVKINNSFPSFKNDKDAKEYKKGYNLNPNLSLIPFTTSKNGVLLGQTLIKAFICLNYLSKEIKNKIEKNESDIIYLTYNEKDNTSINILNDASYLLSNKIEILDKGLKPEYPMNIFLGCISEMMFKSDIKGKEDKNKVIKKIIKYINLGGFIEVGKFYKIGGGHSFSIQGYIQLKEKSDIYYFSVINPHKGGETLRSEEFSEENIKELESIPYENEENKDKCSKISYINKHYKATGHMMLKDEILLDWFNNLTFSESMFGSNELLFIIKDNSTIEIQVNKKSTICIDICLTNDQEIELYKINKLIQYQLQDITNENEIKIVEFEDKVFINKIYEELNKGKYELSFKIINQKYKDSFRCRIKYYEDDIEIKKNENMEETTNFSKVRQLNIILKYVYEMFGPDQFKFIPNIQEYLPNNPEDNDNIVIDYDNNNKLYWVENQSYFDHFKYKIYSTNYKEYTVITLVNLLYFVPILKIIWYKYENKFIVKAPGNESLVLDEKMNILEISDGLKNIPKFKNLIEKQSNFDGQDKYMIYERQENNNINRCKEYINNLFDLLLFSTALAVIVYYGHYIIQLVYFVFDKLFHMLKSFFSYSNANENYSYN